PMSGSPRSLKRRRQYGCDAMKTGMQLTKAHPASSTCSTYHLVAISEPTGRYDTTMSVLVDFKMRLTSSVVPGALRTTSETYLPMPSCVMPRRTGTLRRGTSENLYVLFGAVKIASERSLPTLFTSISNAALNSI